MVVTDVGKKASKAHLWKRSPFISNDNDRKSMIKINREKEVWQGEDAGGEGMTHKMS